MTNKLNSFSEYDESGDVAIQNQGFDAVNNRLLVGALLNPRTFPNTLDGNSNPVNVGDPTVVERGAKSVVWSSEGYTTVGNYVPNGLSVVAVTAAQKAATGTSSNTNIAAQTGIVAAQQQLDFSPYRQLLGILNLASFTGGTSPGITFELDMLDDSGTQVSFPLWNSGSLTAAAKVLLVVGPSIPFMQAAAAPATAPSNFTAFAAPSGWTIVPVPIPFAPQGLFKWTVTGSPTAIAWTAWLYGVR